MTSSQDLLNVFDKYMAMQCNFSYSVCQDIFPGDADHYWQKWKRSNENLLNFLSGLDIMSIRKVMEWGGVEKVYYSSSSGSSKFTYSKAK
jgi:hypothetical protein